MHHARWLPAWTALAVATCAAAGIARGETPRAHRIRLEEALNAVGTAPAHRVGAARVGAARAALPAAAAWPATVLSVATARRTERLGVVASLPLPVFGTIGASRAGARAELEVAERELGADDLGAVRDVTRAWIELARAEALAELSARGVAREEELAAITRTRMQSGDASRAEVVAADAAARRAAARAAGDRAGIAARSAELAALLGRDPDAALHAEGGLPSPAAEVPALAALRGRRGRHPEARAAAARAEVERAKVGEARAPRWPALSLDLEALFDDPTLPGNDYRVGLTLELPLFGRGGARQEAAEASRRAALAERDRTAAALDAALVAAYRRWQQARALARDLDDDAVPAQREAARLAREAYREGQGGLAAVLEADRTLAEAEAEAVAARADAAIARAELEWAAGGAR
jgi:outer membrane protein TolC